MGFGDAFDRTPMPPSLDERMANVADQLESLIALLSGGRPLPRPAPPVADLEQMVNAVVGIKGPATASEIAEALALRLSPSTPASEASGVLAAVHELTETLDHRLRGLGQAFGSSGTATIDHINVTETGLAQETTLAGKATEATLAALKRGITDNDQRLEYDATDKLIYHGKVPIGGLTSDTNWTIQKLTWTGANMTMVQQRTGSWDNRAGLSW